MRESDSSFAAPWRELALNLQIVEEVAHIVGGDLLQGQVIAQELLSVAQCRPIGENRGLGLAHAAIEKEPFDGTTE